jgi:predicted nucleotidyltransferase
MQSLDIARHLLYRNGIDAGHTLLISEVGSTAHGTNVGSDDTDFTAVVIETFDRLVNDTGDKSLFLRTAQGNERSAPGDVDLQVYTLRKFISLVRGGNPSILAALFSGSKYTTPEVLDEIMKIHDLCLSKISGNAFLGYMIQQRQRWMDGHGKRVTRPELVEQFGYDTKYAGHVVRLGLQGVEYMSTGRVTMPMRQSERDIVLSVRAGKMAEPAAIELSETLEQDLRSAIARCPFRGKPDTVEVERLVSKFYWNFYRK